MNSKVRLDPNIVDSEKSEISMHSEGHPQVTCPPDKFFSFSQSFANIDHNQRAFQQKSNSMSRIKNLQQELRSHKGRSNLWEKAKGEIINLNKFLKLSSITLGCSDSAILKQFFDVVLEILEAKQGKNKDERNKAADTKKKENELFEKLVQSNKKKYELQQKLVQYQHELSKLSEINQSLREKSRAQSTDRSSKFHEETMMTLHQKDSVLYSLQQRNGQLKLDVARLEQNVQTLNRRLDLKQRDLAQLREEKEDIQLQLAASNLEIQRMQYAKQETEATFINIKQQIAKIIDENQNLRQELSNIKKIMNEAKTINEQFMNQTQKTLQKSENKQKARIQELLRKQQQVLKKKLVNSIKFTPIRRKSKLKTQKIPSETLLLPSSQQLLI